METVTLQDFGLETDDQNNCSLIFAMTGTKAAIRESLEEMLKYIDGPYGKPCQGRITQYGGEKHIITPIWNGKQY